MFTEQCLNLIRVDKRFIATNGVDPSIGLTTPSMAEAEIKRKMISCAQEVILVTDSSKFGNPALQSLQTWTTLMFASRIQVFAKKREKSEAPAELKSLPQKSNRDDTR